MTALPESSPSTIRSSPGKLLSILAIGFGIALTLCMQGYQSGQSNHTVYLLAALRQVHPELLSNDWFTTQTFQYHALFGWITRALMRLNILEGGFGVGYLFLVAMFHVAWWRLVRVLRGGLYAFVVSEALFHLLAAGTGLGMYQFFQDSAFLPSNISAVAMLWGIVMWLESRKIAAGAGFGIAAAFHLNFALIAGPLWLVLNAWELRHLSGRDVFRPSRSALIATILAMLPAAIHIAAALRRVAPATGGLPAAEFIDLYVRLRHPHHYDPSSWPISLWVTFLLPVAPAAWVLLRREQVRSIFLFFAIVVVLGCVTCYREGLVQASLFRFSIYLKLLSCVGLALVLDRAVFACVGVLIGLMMTAGCLVRGPYLGLFGTVRDDPAYLRACDWVREHTPMDALFIVPPSEQEFRPRARRAIVMNFKAVPQLSAELGAWRDRLQDVLDLPDLSALPRGSFPAALAAIRERYDSLTPEQFFAVSRKYDARYVITRRRWPTEYERFRVDLDGNAAWFLYDLSRQREESTSDGNR